MSPDALDHQNSETSTTRLARQGCPDPTGDCTKMLDAVLREMSAPVLFVQGTRDRLCPLDELDHLHEQITTVNEIHVVQGGTTR